MKWKLTFRYILSFAIVTLIVIQLNVVIFIGASLLINSDTTSKVYGSLHKSESFVRGFEAYIENEEDDTSKVKISEAGMKLLEENNLWIQILDNDGAELYRYNVLEPVTTKYIPIELIGTYKYSGVDGNAATVLAGGKTIGDYNYSYLIGFPMNKVSKNMFIFDNNFLRSFLPIAGVGVVLIDIIVATIVGYIFARSLTKPVKNIINGVEDLSEGVYENYYRERGLYKSVFNKLNNLSDTLKSNELERVKLDQMRNEWIANISHDIKTPLASIQGYAELMGDDYDLKQEERIKYAQIIGNKSNYIKDLLADLTLTMKLKNNYSDISKQDKNIVKLVRECVIDILNDPSYNNVEMNFDTNAEVVILQVDEMLLRRAINNILYNAIIHNNKNVKIDVEVIKKDERVHITIKDNGKGISKEDLEHIFERYYRGTNTGERHKGTGLGMAISKEVIRNHKGDISVESEVGKGTKFEIIL